MYHYTYKITHENGKYYVGRHSTNDLNDGYMGSGIWVRQIKDLNSLSKQILNFYDTQDDLLEAEEDLVNENIDNPYNMNYSNVPSGFSTGEKNPSNRPHANSYLGSNYTDYQREKMVEFNKREETREKRREKNQELVENSQHNFQRTDVKEKAKQTQRENYKIYGHYMQSEENRQKQRDIVQEQLKEGTHNFQKKETKENAAIALKERLAQEGNPMHNPEIAKKLKKPKPKVTCPHCNKEGGKPVMVRYHFDNCKFKDTN